MTEIEFFEKSIEKTWCKILKNKDASPAWDLVNKYFFVSVLNKRFEEYILGAYDIMDFIDTNEYEFIEKLKEYNGTITFYERRTSFKNFDDCMNFINDFIEPKLLAKKFL